MSSNNINDNILALRKLMKEQSVDAYILPTADAHLSEYPAEHFATRKWLSGFTGSAGTIVVTENEAFLWADGRYHIQAESELKGSCISVFKEGLSNVPTVLEWVRRNVKKCGTVAFNGLQVSMFEMEGYQKEFDKKKLVINSELDLVGQIWGDRPSLPEEKIFEHELKYAGKSRVEKLADVRKRMAAEECDCYLISSLDDIAWLYNIRGNDVENTPVAYSYTFITENSATLFINESKVPQEVRKSLEADGVSILPYESVFDFLKSYNEEGTIFLSPKKTNVAILNALPKTLSVVQDIDITTHLKASKSEQEIANIHNSQLKDGVAMVKLIKWLKESVHSGDVCETDVSVMALKFRGEQEGFIDASFQTIAGYMKNGALMHYHAKSNEKTYLKPKGMILVDSGGQYLDGTTDITRTIALGEIPEEMKKDFTLTLKAHIGLANATFLSGTTGAQLDILARRHMWENGLDYKSGTGHGLGYLLCVHEGPQNISPRPVPIPLKVGMLITNEPGVYKEGKWGIRIENTVLVREFYKTDVDTFLHFETVSLCPIERNAILPEMLTDDEKKWLNDYHKMVFDKLSPLLSDDEVKWLEGETLAF